MTLRELEQLHGPYVDLGIAEGRLFENGLRVIGDQFFTILQPPHEHHEKLLVKAEYLRAKIREEEYEFEAYKSSCSEQMRFHAMNRKLCPPPPADAAHRLELRKVQIELLRAQLERVQAQYDATPEGIAAAHDRATQSKVEQRTLQATRRAFDEINSVTID